MPANDITKIRLGCIDSTYQIKTSIQHSLAILSASNFIFAQILGYNG
jgi:hypothetical protein